MIGMKRTYDTAQIIVSLYPTARWAMKDNDLAQLEWHEDFPAPTQEEIDAARVKLEAAEPMRVLKEIRDWYLKESDWTQATDLRAIRGPEWCAAWDRYRQELRDLPTSGVEPYFDERDLIMGITWPTMPEQR